MRFAILIFLMFWIFTFWMTHANISPTGGAIRRDSVISEQNKPKSIIVVTIVYVLMYLTFLSVIWPIPYLLTTGWLFLINKRFWEKMPWLAFIPLLNLMSFVQASWKDPKWFTYMLIWFFFFIIPWIIILIYLINEMSKRLWKWIWTTILLVLFPYVTYPILGYSSKNISLDKNSSDIIMSSPFKKV